MGFRTFVFIGSVFISGLLLTVVSHASPLRMSETNSEGKPLAAFKRAMIQSSWKKGHCLSFSAPDSRKGIPKSGKPLRRMECQGQNGKFLRIRTQRFSLTKNNLLRIVSYDDEEKVQTRCLIPKGYTPNGNGPGYSMVGAQGVEAVTCDANDPGQAWDFQDGRIVHRKSEHCMQAEKKSFKHPLHPPVLMRKCTNSIKQRWLLHGEFINRTVDQEPCYAPGNTPINEARFVRAHNAYEPQFFSSFTEPLEKGAATVLEIDLTPHEDKLYVSHSGKFQRNNCGPNGNASFARCLMDLKDWHDDNRNHRPVMVVLNVKTQYADLLKDSDWLWKRIDADIKERLGSLVYRPVDRIGSETNLRRALDKPWPTIDKLRGRFLVFLNVGPGLVLGALKWESDSTWSLDLSAKANDNKWTMAYVNTVKRSKAYAFACPHASDADDFTNDSKWEGVNGMARHMGCVTIIHPRHTFINKSSSAKKKLKKYLVDMWNPVGMDDSFVVNTCFVGDGKTFACADDPRGFKKLVEAGANFQESNFPNSYPWARDGLRGKTGCEGGVRNPNLIPYSGSLTLPGAAKERPVRKKRRTGKKRLKNPIRARRNR